MMTSMMRKYPDFFRKETRMTVKMRKKNMIRSMKRKIRTKKMKKSMMKMEKKATTLSMRPFTRPVLRLGACCSGSGASSSF